MSWRHEQVTMSRGQWIGALIGGSFVFSIFPLTAAGILAMVLDWPFWIYFFRAAVALVTFSMLLRIVMSVHYLIRRRARLRRMQARKES